MIPKNGNSRPGAKDAHCKTATSVLTQKEAVAKTQWLTQRKRKPLQKTQ